MSGRATKRKVMNLGTNIDGAVRRIEYAYDSLGRQTTVTQYDAVSAGNVVDQVAFTYTDWGLPFEAKNDHDSAVGGSYLYQIDYTYAKATTGRNTIRRTGMTLPSGNVLTYQYSSTSDLHDDELSRVTRVQDGAVDLARYYYNGAGHVVGTDLPEADVWSRQYSGSTFPDLDRFNRPIKWRWTKDLATDIDFYDRDCIFDENSNVTVFDEHVHTGFDVKYTIDDLDRLIDEQRGTYSTGTITSETLQQTWTLDQVGNWPAVVLDLTNDGDGFDAGETDEERTHNDVNELTDRDIENDGDAMYDDILYDLTFDANGNLTDDGENYEYVYDAFNRLRKVKNTSTQALVAEYRYNGLNYRITSHEDTDGNGTVNGSDTILHFAYDERWRIVAVFEDSSSDPHEEFVHHNAGDSGFGTSSYIDAVVLRDRDADGDVNHDLEERRYYCQNWRHDVVALVTDTGKLVEQVRYDAYGKMFGFATGDTDSDGDFDATDASTITTAINYDVRNDPEMDNDMDAADVTFASSITGGYQTLGRGVLSSTNVGGYDNTGWDLVSNMTGSIIAAIVIAMQTVR